MPATNAEKVSQGKAASGGGAVPPGSGYCWREEGISLISYIALCCRYLCIAFVFLSSPQTVAAQNDKNPIEQG
jgi:hypothetical protein